MAHGIHLCTFHVVPLTAVADGLFRMRLSKSRCNLPHFASVALVVSYPPK